MADQPVAVRRRRWRRAGLLLAAALAAFGLAVLAGLPVALPFDIAINLLPAVEAPAWRVPADGKRRVVVLQHGLWRTPWSLWRLERTLAAHGYEVLNPGYPSTRDRIDLHAARLAAAIDARLAAGPVDELSFVGHSLGGLVIQQYLRQPGAPAPHACVYLATPHRGAVLADLRRHWFLFRLAMGDGAALELSRLDPRHELPIPWRERSGALVGDRGAGNASIPGADDGTVGVEEATLPGAATVVLSAGHTSITIDPEAHRQTLCFLRTRGFAPPPRSG